MVELNFTAFSKNLDSMLKAEKKEADRDKLVARICHDVKSIDDIDDVALVNFADAVFALPKFLGDAASAQGMVHAQIRDMIDCSRVRTTRLL